MNVVVFLGPTLSTHEASRELAATYLPPAAQGDVYRAAKERPFAIGIIDGYFERLPAVWHKEILWALAHGVHVFGAASMGALRAAELSAFGMVGVGQIFEAFRSEQLEDDDEVAVSHGDRSSGYRPTSEAMVNVRATLAGAEAAGVIGPALRADLERVAKSLFYPDRSYPRVFSLALERGAPAAEIEAVRAYVATGRVDQKRNDALTLLSAIRECVAAGAPPAPARFSLAHTEAWASAVEWAESQPPLTDSGDVSAGLLAAEVRLSGSKGPEWLARAWSRTLAAALARCRPVPNRSARASILDGALRKKYGEEPATFDAWLEKQDLTPEAYGAFLDREVDLDWARECYCQDVDRHLVDELRVQGEYARMAESAREKHVALVARGLAQPSPADAGVAEHELFEWYFAQRGSDVVPDPLDRFVLELGIPDLPSLQREALRAFLHSSRLPNSK